ncbi:hypothetical protein TEA_014475 [Camellia sinensis var. sinensis]|uniref:LOB domain-containing protein n=1 Tax=Camellia sinensis var. sinensis TaxID=542762 RepID=A0A4S4EJF3_CAMSN|nr:hypothetical protein TEA_014475 [Camellia sinensis var. sinensis]
MAVPIMPCAACKFLRRRCTNSCILLPYFPPSEPEKFVAVHKEVPVDDREDAVTSMVYEAKARLRDPVYGCVAFVSSLQSQVFHLQSELNAALAEAMALRAQLSEVFSTVICSQASPSSTSMAKACQDYCHDQQLTEGTNHNHNHIHVDTSNVMPLKSFYSLQCATMSHAGSTSFNGVVPACEWDPQQ